MPLTWFQWFRKLRRRNGKSGFGVVAGTSGGAVKFCASSDLADTRSKRKRTMVFIALLQKNARPVKSQTSQNQCNSGVTSDGMSTELDSFNGLCLLAKLAAMAAV